MLECGEDHLRLCERSNPNIGGRQPKPAACRQCYARHPCHGSLLRPQDPPRRVTLCINDLGQGFEARLSKNTGLADSICRKIAAGGCPNVRACYPLSSKQDPLEEAPCPLPCFHENPLPCKGCKSSQLPASGTPTTSEREKEKGRERERGGPPRSKDEAWGEGPLSRGSANFWMLPMPHVRLKPQYRGKDPHLLAHATSFQWLPLAGIWELLCQGPSSKAWH